MKRDVSVFETKFGWFGIVGSNDSVCRLTIGHRTKAVAWRELRKRLFDDELIEKDWHPKLRKRLESFAAGKLVTFDDIELQIENRTEFQQNVLSATRAIGYGEVATYGELAARVGSPKAARAVGAVMASNHIPILIPCHRVVGSQGALTGLSAPRGIAFKQQLLEMEQSVRAAGMK